MDLDEGVCAACGKPLGLRAGWRMANGGRAYHNECEPTVEAEPQGRTNVRSLGDFAERKARNVLHGKGQQQLEEVPEDG